MTSPRSVGLAGLALAAGLALGGCAAGSAEAIGESAPAPTASANPERPKLTLFRGIERIQAAAEPKARYAGMTHRGATITLFWKGPLHRDVKRAIAYVRSHSDLTVVVRQADYSQVELDRASERLFNGRDRLATSGIHLMDTTTPSDGSGINMGIRRDPALSDAKWQKLRALAKREGGEIARVRILNVGPGSEGHAA